MQFLPDPLRGVAKAAAREAGARHAVIGIAGQLVFAAQARQPIDEKNAVELERLR